MIKIKAREEIVLCKKCARPVKFYYLSDFTYGARLILVNNGKEYAYINLFEDKVFSEFEEMLKDYLNTNGIEINNKDFYKLMDTVFGITCDDIKGHSVNFDDEMKKCINCGSIEFDDNLLEPDKIVTASFYEITHVNWEKFNYLEKENLLKKAMNSLINI